MAKKKTKILTGYYYGLGEYLDLHGYEWQHVHKGNEVVIYILQELNPTQIFNLAIDYMRWYQKINNNE
jgi:hypothetical protein